MGEHGREDWGVVPENNVDACHQLLKLFEGQREHRPSCQANLRNVLFGLTNGVSNALKQRGLA
jgi:hypothetical protein